MHDTELCADESGCEAEVFSLDLCRTHYFAQQYRKTLPPVFRRHPRNWHRLAEANDEGLRWCGGCRVFVKVAPHGNRIRCSNASSQISRKKHTGWGPEDYDLALVAQANRCALCGNPPGKKGLAADHCHTSGRTRKLLCSHCNTGLGLFKDNPETLEAAARYIREHTQTD